MTKRLGIFLGLGFVGVVLLLTGLAWDAVAHANDPSLAGREGIFTLGNPGHVLLGLGIGLVLVSLIGGCETLLASAAERPVGPARRPPGVPGGERGGGAVGGGGHVVGRPGGPRPPGARARHGPTPPASWPRRWTGRTATRAAGGPRPAITGDAAEGTPAPSRPTHGARRRERPPGADASHGGHTSTSVVHDHVADRPGQTRRRRPAAHGHGPTTVAGRSDDLATAQPRSRPGQRARGASSTTGRRRPIPPGPAGPGRAAGNVGRACATGRSWSRRPGPAATPTTPTSPSPASPKPCTNCFLLEFQPDLVYADGTSANLDTGMMLHHAVFFAAGRQDPTCGPERALPRQARAALLRLRQRTHPGVPSRPASATTSTAATGAASSTS